MRSRLGPSVFRQGLHAERSTLTAGSGRKSCAGSPTSCESAPSPNFRTDCQGLAPSPDPLLRRTPTSRRGSRRCAGGAPAFLARPPVPAPARLSRSRRRARRRAGGFRPIARARRTPFDLACGCLPTPRPSAGEGPGAFGAGVRPDLGRAPRPALFSPSRAAAPRGASSRAAPVFRPPRRRSRGALRSSGGSGPARRLLRATSNQTGSSGGQDIVWRSRYRDRTIIGSGRPGSFGTESALTGPSAALASRPPISPGAPTKAPGPCAVGNRQSRLTFPERFWEKYLISNM